MDLQKKILEMLNGYDKKKQLLTIILTSHINFSQSISSLIQISLDDVLYKLINYFSISSRLNSLLTKNFTDLFII